LIEGVVKNESGVRSPNKGLSAGGVRSMVQLSPERRTLAACASSVFAGSLGVVAMSHDISHQYGGRNFFPWILLISYAVLALVSAGLGLRQWLAIRKPTG